MLIDCGMSAREIERRLESIDAPAADLSAVIITHEHHDHVGSSGVMSRRRRLPVYATAGTFGAAAKALGNVGERRRVQAGESFSIGDLWIEPFSQPHDAAEPVGMSVRCGAAKLTIITDLGYITHLVRERLRGSQALILEANHDRHMLQEGPYPWAVKQRVSGRMGHLSNDSSAAFLGQAADEHLRYVILAHLSQTNNDPSLARDVHQAALDGCPAQLSVAEQHRATEVYSL